jgi:hypothetical protein
MFVHDIKFFARRIAGAGAFLSLSLIDGCADSANGD